MSIYAGNCAQVLAALPDQSVHCCVTSPPYWGLRDYGTATWKGGSIDCTHQDEDIGQGIQYRHTCGWVEPAKRG